MNFYFVDRIHQLIPGEKTLAVKHITAGDCYFLPGADNKPKLISCIIGEALGQLCSWNVIKASDFQLRLIGGVVGEVTMHDDFYLGDSVIMENTIDRLDLENQVVSFHGVAKVNDRVILEVKNGLGPLLSVADFGDPEEVKRQYASIFRPGPLPEITEGKIIPADIDVSNRYLQFDKILKWEKGKEVIANKYLSLTAPYFSDHFPYRPVMPLSLLLESKLQLAYPFIAELVGDAKKDKIKVEAVKRIKIGEFVEPGDVLTAKMTLKEHSDKHFVLSFRSEANNKRVCVCEAVFSIR